MPGFCIGGSWPAFLVATALNEHAAAVQALLHLDAPLPPLITKYDDVDVYAGRWDGNAFQRRPGPTAYTKVHLGAEEYDVNTVPCINPNVVDLLNGNDINMTGVAMQCTGGVIDCHFHPAFWHFMLSKERVVALLHPESATAVQLVRCAFKVRVMAGGLL